MIFTVISTTMKSQSQSLGRLSRRYRGRRARSHAWYCRSHSPDQHRGRYPRSSHSRTCSHERPIRARALAAFWHALRTSTTTITPGVFINLPENAYFLGDPTLGSRVYIRHCYPKLLEQCWNIIHDSENNTPHLVILGNPGIGKTCFGCVLLLELVRKRATVVYEDGASENRFLFTPNGTDIGSRDSFLGILDRPSTYYIVDGVKPKYFPAKTILMTSPDHEVWYQFHKTNCLSLFMPVWTETEIFQCHELMLSHVPKTVVANCFRQWGGIARYVLRFAEATVHQNLLLQALSTVNLNTLIQTSGDFDGKDGIITLMTIFTLRT